jgi:hypothetical protein
MGPRVLRAESGSVDGTNRLVKVYRLARLAIGPNTNLEASPACREFIPLPSGQVASGASRL